MTLLRSKNSLFAYYYLTVSTNKFANSVHFDWKLVLNIIIYREIK